MVSFDDVLLEMLCTLSATHKEVNDLWFDVVCGQVLDSKLNPQGLLDFFLVV